MPGSTWRATHRLRLMCDTPQIALPQVSDAPVLSVAGRCWREKPPGEAVVLIGPGVPANFEPVPAVRNGHQQAWGRPVSRGPGTSGTGPGWALAHGPE